MNLGLSLASALLLILLFPGFNLTWLAPVALAPILIACARERSWKRRWFYGWAAGVVFWCGVCPWIEFVMEVHGGMGRWGGWGTFVLFGLYKGLHMAVFATLAGFLMPRWWAIPAVAALWTGIERTHGFFGFAWLDLGNAGIDMPLPMRLAPITGVYGLVVRVRDARLRGSADLRPPPAPRIALASALLVLLALPRAPRPEAPSRKALLVQPNIDTEMQWTEDNLRDLGAADGSALAHPRRGRHPVARSARAVLPERSRPSAITPRSRASRANSLLFGAVGFTPQREPLNSAVMLDPSGKVVDRYDKINLVPFGEFIPPLFGWVNRITKEIGDFVPGDRVVIFPVANTSSAPSSATNPPSPTWSASSRRSGAEVLVNLSNDGYFGNSAAHAAAPGDRPHARRRKSPLDSARHQRRHHRRDRPPRPRRRTHAALHANRRHDALRVRNRPEPPTRATATGSPGPASRVGLLLMSAGSPAHRRP